MRKSADTAPALPHSCLLACGTGGRCVDAYACRALKGHTDIAAIIERTLRSTHPVVAQGVLVGATSGWGRTERRRASARAVRTPRRSVLERERERERRELGYLYCMLQFGTTGHSVTFCTQAPFAQITVVQPRSFA